MLHSLELGILMEKEEQHRHGGSPQVDLCRLNLPEGPILDFSVNLNSLGPPGIIADRWMDMIDGIEEYPSSANFILCQWQLTHNLDDLLRHLLSDGIYVRDCRNFHGLEDNYFRSAVRSPAENDRLISTISSFASNFYA